MAKGLPQMVASPVAHGNKLFMASGVVHGTTGKVRAWGRKPWLATRLSSVFKT